MSAAASAAALTSGVSRDATVLIALSPAARSSAVDARSVAVRWRGPLTTKTWPLEVSDVCTAIAAASRTPGWLMVTSSISPGDMFSPPRMITSALRPWMNK